MSQYIAFVSYSTRITQGENTAGHGVYTVSDGASTEGVLSEICQRISEAIDQPVEDIIVTCFNVLPATVGGNNLEEEI